MTNYEIMFIVKTTMESDKIKGTIEAMKKIITDGKGKIVETKDIRNITQSEIAVDNLLNLFKENEVTPVNAQEIMYDLRKNILI